MAGKAWREQVKNGGRTPFRHRSERSQNGGGTHAQDQDQDQVLKHSPRVPISPLSVAGFSRSDEKSFQPIITYLNARPAQFLAERNPLTITEQQGRAIAYLLHEIRPDWGIASLVSLIDKHAESPDLGPLIIAATTKAMEPTCQTPAPIFHPGPHWPAKAKAKMPRPEPCPDHIGEAAHNCRCCWADTKAGLRPEGMIGKHYEAPPNIADQLEATIEAVPTGAASVVQGDE